MAKFENNSQAEAAKNVKNVFTISGKADYEAIRERLKRSHRVVILKADLLGLEFATTLRRQYPNLPITVVDSETRPLESVYGPDIAK